VTSSYQPGEHHESAPVETLGRARRHDYILQIERPFEFEGVGGMQKSFCITPTEELKRVHWRSQAPKRRNEAQRRDTRLRGVQLSLGGAPKASHDLPRAPSKPEHCRKNIDSASFVHIPTIPLVTTFPNDSETFGQTEHIA
jgi:hypothetical protein